MGKESMGWVGKAVRHANGRKGRISREVVGHCYVGLTLTVDGSEATDSVQLNADGRDSGATGWLWRHTDEGVSPEIWSRLGDHNDDSQ